MGIIAELKRRNVARMAALYIVAAWLVIQVADVVLDAMELPAVWMRLVLIVLLAGFPVALVFSWVYEITPEGLKRESELDRDESIAGESGRKLNVLIAILLVAVLIAVGAGRLISDSPDGMPSMADSSTADAPDFSVAVLPFANRSAQEDDVYFVDGMHDDILTQLAAIESLTVTSRTSVERFRGTTESIPQIAATLGVRNILEGGIQRAGDRVRINMQLIDARNDDHLWAETFERELTAANIFEVQADIARAVTEAMHVTLRSEEKEALNVRPTDSIEAYDLYLLGRYHMNKRTAESIQLAKEYFESAIEIDPGYVLALSGLADSYTLLVDYGNMDGDAVYPLAQQAIDTAMALDDSVSEVWASQGALLHSQAKVESAKEALLRAIELDDKNFQAWLWYGNVSDAMRSHSDALAAYEAAYALEPMSRPVNANLADRHRNRGEFARARQHYERLAQLSPSDEGFYRAEIAESYLHQGQLALAVAGYRQILATDPRNQRALLWLGNAYLLLRDPVSAREWYARTELVAPLVGARFALYEAQGNFDDATMYMEDILSRVGNRRIVPVIAALFRSRILAGDITGAAIYLTELLGLLNGQMDINPSDWDQMDELLVAGFLISHGDANGLSSAQGRKMLHEILTGLSRLNAQGYEHPMTLISLSVAHALDGDMSASVNYANAAVDRGYMGWYNVRAYPGMSDVFTTLDETGVLLAVETARSEQASKLEGMSLAAAQEVGARQPIAMSRDAFQEYVGFYSDGNILFNVYVETDGSFAALGGQAGPVLDLRPLGDDEFFTNINANILLKFGRDDAAAVSHMLFQISGTSQRFKRTDPPPSEIFVAREDLLRYEGTYAWARPVANPDERTDADYWVAEISVDEDGILWVDFDNQPKLYLTPYAESLFHLTGFDTTFKFVFDNATGNASRILFRQDGGNLEFIRQ